MSFLGTHGQAQGHYQPNRHALNVRECRYCHVKVDGTGTKFYPTVEIYERTVVRNLNRIHQSHSGQAVFREFSHRSHHLMTIIPYEKAELNAFAQAKDILKATPKGETLRSAADGHILLDNQGRHWVGTGGGSDSDIAFTPGRFTIFCRQQKKGHKSGAQPDEILFHEMVHATRQMRGLLNPLPLGFLYDTEEEFFAILLANIYASETGRQIDLRSDHHTFEHLTTDTNELFLPKKDVGDYRYRLVEKLVHQEPKMAHELLHLRHTPFNPIRRYFDLQKTSLHISRHRMGRA